MNACIIVEQSLIRTLCHPLKQINKQCNGTGLDICHCARLQKNRDGQKLLGPGSFPQSFERIYFFINPNYLMKKGVMYCSDRKYVFEQLISLWVTVQDYRKTEMARSFLNRGLSREVLRDHRVA